MNNFEDVYGLNRDDRQISNLETYRRFISKGDKPLQCINDEDAKAIKDALNGKGKLLAVVDGRRTMAGNHKYVLFVKEEGGVKVYLYTVLNGLYNDMGPYKDLDTAMSNADCYGLFEECKQVANKKVLNEGFLSVAIGILLGGLLLKIVSKALKFLGGYAGAFKNASEITADIKRELQVFLADGKTEISVSELTDIIYYHIVIKAVHLGVQDKDKLKSFIKTYVTSYLKRNKLEFSESNSSLFEKILNESIEDEEEFEDWDSEGFDDVCEGDMEDWDWDDYDDEYGGPNPHQEMEDHLADSFPTRDSEYQDDDGDYSPFNYVQMGDGEGSIGKKTKPAAYANHLNGGDYAPTFDDGTVLGGNFKGTKFGKYTDNSDADFAMSDDADLDAWAREE